MRVKVCGLTDPANAIEVARAGADWIGLNFHPASKRFVTTERAASIVSALPEPAGAVGVFVDRPVEETLSVASGVGLRIVQLHGDEPPGAAVRLKRSGLAVVKAFRLADVSSVRDMLAFVREVESEGLELDGVLVDTFVPGQAGGTGRALADELLDALPPLPRLILAGGLNPGNVAERVARVRPWMVDVAGGVESAPGIKDPAKVSAFFRAAQGRDASRAG